MNCTRLAAWGFPKGVLTPRRGSPSILSCGPPGLFAALLFEGPFRDAFSEAKRTPKGDQKEVQNTSKVGSKMGPQKIRKMAENENNLYH